MDASPAKLTTRQRHALAGMGIDVWMPVEEPEAPDMPVAPAWTDLQAEVAGCHRCALSESRRQTVFGVGNSAARWMLIGEAPGAEEDRQGEPFVGRGGQLLNEMLRAAGVGREQVYIANILKCRPPDNRDPQAEEISACADYLARQVALVQPGLILAVGRISAQSLLDTKAAVGRLRGQVHHYGEQNIPLVVTYHPAYLLRSPAQKPKAWDDLCLARSVLEPGAP
ncbi:MAG: uracil-DNA glycosylase [Gammaproteobacteria bacterium]